MTIRKLKTGFEVKLPLVPDSLLVLQCDALEQAQQLDAIGRIYERLVNDEPCELQELEAALSALESVGWSQSPLHGRLAVSAARLRA